MAAKLKKIFDAKIFCFVIALGVFLLILLIDSVTIVFTNAENKMLDSHFHRVIMRGERQQEGVLVHDTFNPFLHPDILILGIDFRSLDRFGRWPFPRSTHADLVNNLSRISDQTQRENSLFLDIFFIEPHSNAYEDVLLVDAINNSGTVLLETVLDELEPPSSSYNEYFSRQQALYDTAGVITNVSGDWQNTNAFYGLQPPLQPYAKAVSSYGHPNFIEDHDSVFRRQILVAKSSKLIATLRLEDLTAEYIIDEEKFERLVWIDNQDKRHSIPYPLTEANITVLRRQMEDNAPKRRLDTTGDGQIDDEFHLIRKYQDSFVPSITLAIVLQYTNRSLEDIEVVFGEHIIIPSPQQFNSQTNTWEPYKILRRPAIQADEGVQEAVYEAVPEIRIPIDHNAAMLINYIGPRSNADPTAYQTFPVRSYSAYAVTPPGTDASTWPRTKALDNKIVMVGAFSRGMAADEKMSPFGLMYGVEMHANALNTILMGNFINHAEKWVNTLILFGLIFLIAFFSSRLSPIPSSVLVIILCFSIFFTVPIVFQQYNYLLNMVAPIIASLFSFVSIVIYRVMTEQRDKRRIRETFGKYVSPSVVSEILNKPPELGGVDKELTVFFSDIRGFTTLSESLTPQELVNHLNLYLTAMTDIILDFKGTLDKYIGDEIMCFWGAPLPQAEHALLACKCALKQMEKLNELNASWPAEKRIDIGIGINSGVMTVGNMGSLGRMNYTLMGDNVNLGARLEGTNKQYYTNIIISEFTYGLVKDRILARELDNIRVKGKNKPVLIYELIDVNED